MKVLTVFGTRPEAIKLARVLAKLQERSNELESVVCVTAQHRALLDDVLDVFHIRPRYDLKVMRHDQTLGELTRRVLEGVAQVVETEDPDVVLVQGDTTTCMVAALAAYYAKVPVAHVEAGLRTGDKYAPFPEEMNRRLVDSMATYLYAPTEPARRNLLREGVPDESILVTGNTVVDALIWAQQKLESISPPLGIDLTGRRLLLVTAHRRESFGEGIRNICQAILDIVEKVDDVLVVFPLHPNPNVGGPVSRMLTGVDRIAICDPVGYLELVWLMTNADLVLTDSGGIQEEATTLGVPLLVARDKTERPEALQIQTTRLVGTDSGVICREATAMLLKARARQERKCTKSPFGDGRAAERIADHLARVAAGEQM